MISALFVLLAVTALMLAFLLASFKVAARADELLGLDPLSEARLEPIPLVIRPGRPSEAALS